MYATCIHCHGALGRNEALEHFPVGRRVAFDADKGRLWVVCPHCGQWNLSPIEERWEAIEQAEQRYRDTAKRVATDQIGLARLPDGAELIRIGRPVLPEYAAWRYGPRFRSRFARHALFAGGVISFGAGVIVLGPVLGVAATGGWMLPVNGYQLLRLYVDSHRLRATFPHAGHRVAVTKSQLSKARLVALPEDPDGWGVRIEARRTDLDAGRFVRTADASAEHVLLTGVEARAAAAAALPVANERGGSARTVEHAVSLLESRLQGSDHFRDVAQRFEALQQPGPREGLSALPPEVRLALEMAAHEQAERRAMEGELAALADAWKHAEEIAAIADDLTLPQQLLARLERLGRKA